ncbi:MAG: hypothetical protein ABSF43_18260 [Rectinemataceae bacterium]
MALRPFEADAVLPEGYLFEGGIAFDPAEIGIECEEIVEEGGEFRIGEGPGLRREKGREMSLLEKDRGEVLYLGKNGS